MNDSGVKKKSASAFRQRIRAWIEKRLKGTHDHFLCEIPTDTGTLSSLGLEYLFAGIVMENEQLEKLKRLPSNALIVYITKYKSHFDYLFYHTRYRKIKQPVPELGLNYRFFWLQRVSRIFRVSLAHLDILVRQRSFHNPYHGGFIRNQIKAGRAAFISLVEKKGFYRRFVKSKKDPIEYLIELQKTIDVPIILVPHLMFFGKNPEPRIPSIIDLLFGTEQKPGLTRKMVKVIRNPGKVFVEISEPLVLKRFIETPEIYGRSNEYQALKLRRQILQQFNRHRQSITGPLLKYSEEVKESILASDRLRAFMEQYSRNRKEPLFKVRKKADAYLDEIKANYKPFVIRIMSGVVGWIIHTMYDGAVVDKKGLSRVKAASQKAPLILLPCHKSHIDYLILSYVLYHNNMPCPHIAAGKNLSFWPMGPIFRSGGAFFIRRTFRGAVLYSKVFSEYIYRLLADGFNIEQFIEGGRSRTGKLLMPKLGLLSIMINAFKNGACQDMIFVPVYIGYDQVLEENAYIHEIEGGQKEPENLKQVVQARKFLKKRYGKIYINFHEPISMNALTAGQEVPFEKRSSKEQNIFIRNLGWRIINSIDRQTVVTPHALLATVLLNTPKKRFTYQDIMTDIETYLHLLTAQKAKLSDTLAFDSVRATEQALEAFLQRKLLAPVAIHKDAPLKETSFSLNRAKRPLLEYYKNNCIAYFVPAVFTATAILEKDAFQFSASDLQTSYTRLQDFFKYEFAFNNDLSQEYFVRKGIKSFIDNAILMPHRSLPDTYNITSSGFRKLKLYANFLKAYFESYWVVLQYFKQYGKGSHATKERIKKIQAMGSRMHKSKEIQLPESLSKINYTNAIQLFINHGIKGSEDSEKLAHHEKVIQRHLDLIDK
jgi:glycerol-3-phosphate O-acyltransferase